MRFIFDRMNVNWKDLARIDDLLTRRFVDSEKNNSHKTAVEVTPDMPTRSELEKSELYQKVEKLYEMLKNILDIKPLRGNYSRDSGFVSYGVFAKNLLPSGCRIPFLFGFLAPISVADIRDGENDFSIFDLSSAEKLSSAERCSGLPHLSILHAGTTHSMIHNKRKVYCTSKWAQSLSYRGRK